MHTKRTTGYRVPKMLRGPQDTTGSPRPPKTLRGPQDALGSPRPSRSPCSGFSVHRNPAEKLIQNWFSVKETGSESSNNIWGCPLFLAQVLGDPNVSPVTKFPPR